VRRRWYRGSGDDDDDDDDDDRTEFVHFYPLIKVTDVWHDTKLQIDLYATDIA